jgi:hypothetical protein
VVMESTALYWRPVWLALEEQYMLHLAQAQSNAAPRGRKSDYADALRLVRRFRELKVQTSTYSEARAWWSCVQETACGYSRKSTFWGVLQSRIRGRGSGS